MGYFASVVVSPFLPLVRLHKNHILARGPGSISITHPIGMIKVSWSVLPTRCPGNFYENLGIQCRSSKRIAGSHAAHVLPWPMSWEGWPAWAEARPPPRQLGGWRGSAKPLGMRATKKKQKSRRRRTQRRRRGVLRLQRRVTVHDP